MKCLTNLDMVKNQILNGIIQKVTADPTTKLVEGWLIYNTTDKKFKYYDGTSWIAVGGGSGSGSTGGGTVNIDTTISSTSTNSNASGSKAVYDFVTDEMSDIRSVTNGNVLIVDDNGDIIGISVDTAVTASSTNLITSDAVKAYVDSKMTTSDAMVFKGTVDATGVISSTDTDINGKNITGLTEYINGWTFKATASMADSVLSTGTAIEAGDMIIVEKDATAYSANIISVIQTNIDGVVTGPDTSTDEAVVLFDGTSGKLIKSSTITKTQLLELFDHAFNLAAEADSPDVVLKSSNTDDNTIVKPGQTVTATLTDTTVTAGNYGNNDGVLNGDVDDKDSFTVPDITVDAKGRITSAKNTTIRLNLESKATRHDFNNPQLVPNENNECTWTIELNHTEMPIVTLYEVSSKEIIIADVKDNAANDAIIVTFKGITNDIAAGTYHATVIA